MPELTITVTIQVPDNQDDKNKLVALLRHVDDQISHYANERIQEYDRLNIELNSALETNLRPSRYKERIKSHYREAQGWNNARVQAQTAIWPFINKLMGLGERK